MDIRLVTTLHTPELAKAFKTLRIAEGLTMEEVGLRIGFSDGAVKGRETRGINNIDEIDAYLKALGYKAMLVITKL